MGGLSRKAFLIKNLVNDSHQPALIVNGGNLLFNADRLEPDTVESAKITADGVLQASQKMGAGFAGIGSRDLAAGIAFLNQYQKPPAFTWLSLNLVDPVSRTPLFAPVLHRQVGDLKIALLALTNHAAYPHQSPEFEVTNWRKALPEALTKVENTADMTVLLSNYSLSENMEMARNHDSIDLILQTGHAVGNMTPTVVNKTLIAQAEIRGKYLGVMDIEWNGRGKWSGGASILPAQQANQPASIYANRFIAVKQSLVKDPEIEALVKQTQQRLAKGEHGQKP